MHKIKLGHTVQSSKLIILSENFHPYKRFLNSIKFRINFHSAYWDLTCRLDHKNCGSYKKLIDFFINSFHVCLVSQVSKFANETTLQNGFSYVLNTHKCLLLLPCEGRSEFEVQVFNKLQVFFLQETKNSRLFITTKVLWTV